MIEQRLIVRPDARAENFDHWSALVRFFAHRGGIVYELPGPHPLHASAIKAIAHEGARHEVIKGDPLAHEYEPCDLVIADNALSRLRPGDQPWFARRLYDALNPGGALAIVDVIQTTPWSQDLIHTLHMAMAQDMGLQAEDVLAEHQHRAAINPLPRDLCVQWRLPAPSCIWGRLLYRASWVVQKPCT